MTTASPTPGEPAVLNALAALAEREHRAGRLGEAASAYRQILTVRPDVAEMHNNLGNVLSDQGKVDEAMTEYERAAALKPSLFQGHTNLGRILWKQGKLDQAAARYQQASRDQAGYCRDARQPGPHPLGAAKTRPGRG